MQHGGRLPTVDQVGSCEWPLINLGLDSSEYSFGYIAGWAGGGDDAIKAITVSGNRIQSTAKKILDALDAQVVAA